MFSRCLTVRHPWFVQRSAAYPFCNSRHFSKLTPLEQSLLFKFCCSNCGLFSVVLVLFHLRSICRFVHSAWAKILFFVFCVSISRPIVALDPLTQINWHPSFPPHRASYSWAFSSNAFNSSSVECRVSLVCYVRAWTLRPQWLYIMWSW
jgi:hypothetical protein